MYNIYVIYKLTHNSEGYAEKVDIVECDMDETSAAKFSKFFNNQVSSDLKGRVQYFYQATRVV